MQITPQVIEVMLQIEQNQVYRTRQGGSEQYLANVAIVQQLMQEGYISSLGRCRRDYFLTRAGEKVLKEHTNA